jgi:hypothetical protein
VAAGRGPKNHYRMNLIDAAGTQLGTAILQFPLKNDPAGSIGARWPVQNEQHLILEWACVYCS